jgi:hypothetical protein
MIIGLNIAAAASAIIAAYLWLRSATIKAPYRDEPDESGIHPEAITIDEGDGEVDFIETTIQQARWSKRAALAAGASAFFQALSLLFQVWTGLE